MDPLCSLLEEALLEENEEAMEVATPAPVALDTMSSTVDPTAVASSLVKELPETSEAAKSSASPAIILQSTVASENLSANERPKTNAPTCSLCKKPHPLVACFRFRRLRHEEKLRHLLIWGHCSRCLASNHKAKDCASGRKCSKCQEDHHTLIHLPKGNDNIPQKSNNNLPLKKKKKPTKAVPSRASQASMTPLPLRHVVTFSPTVQVKLQVGGSEFPVRAVIDVCCDISYVSDQLVRKLKLTAASGYCHLSIRSIYDCQKRISLTAKIKQMHGIKTPRISVVEAVKERFPGLQLADPTFYHSGQVALVLGPELSPQIMTGNVFSSPGSPLAQYTIFGWVISGPSPL